MSSGHDRTERHRSSTPFQGRGYTRHTLAVEPTCFPDNDEIMDSTQIGGKAGTFELSLQAAVFNCGGFLVASGLNRLRV